MAKVMVTVTFNTKRCVFKFNFQGNEHMKNVYAIGYLALES